MINRVLIRIKVVQMLYSYLLTEKHFSIEPQPIQPTKEKRFAYRIYIDTLALFVELSRNLGKKSKMNSNRFTEALASIDKIKAILAQRSHGEEYGLNNIIDSLTDEIKASGLYKLYLKKDTDENLPSDVKVWKELFEHVIRNSRAYNISVEQYDNYSLRGMERMREMMEATFENFMTSHGGIRDALNQLRESLMASRELYFRLLMLPVAITELRIKDIQAGQAKHLPTAEDINPDMRLTESPLITLISDNVQVQENVEKFGIHWNVEAQELIRALLQAVMRSEAYARYKETAPSLKADYTFWKNILTEVISGNELFLEEMETKSVFWNDDIDIMTEFVIKTFRRFEDGLGQNSILSMYKDDDDEQFGRNLFTYVIDNKSQYRAIIDNCLDSKIWESDRLAYMDVVIVLTAMAEMLNFPSIPLKVTINEYIEIAKAYSTNKSGMFVNGLLGVIVAKLRRDGLLLK